MQTICKLFGIIPLTSRRSWEVIKSASLSTTEVGALKLHVTNLQAELEEAMSDFQVAQSTIRTQQEQLQTLETQHTIRRTEWRISWTHYVELSLSVSSLSRHPTKSLEVYMKSLGFWQKLQELDGGSNEAVSTIYLLGNSGCRKSEISR